jgi:hypothetical protein
MSGGASGKVRELADAHLRRAPARYLRFALTELRLRRISALRVTPAFRKGRAQEAVERQASPVV